MGSRLRCGTEHCLVSHAEAPKRAPPLPRWPRRLCSLDRSHRRNRTAVYVVERAIGFAGGADTEVIGGSRW